MRYDSGMTMQQSDQPADARVYQDWVEPRSFGCKKCSYVSTNRRVVEQHLRQMHADLFDGTAVTGATGGVPDQSPGASPAPAAAGLPSIIPASVGQLPAGSGPVTFYTDAGTWENGTKRQRSVLAVWDGRTRSIVVHENLAGTTSNEAEYAAIIAALELARDQGLSGVQIRADSQLCVNQINGRWQVKEERLRAPRDRAARLLKALAGSIEWVPRERNHAGIFLEKEYKR